MKNKDKLVSKKKEETVPEVTLSRKESFLKELKELIKKHNVNYVTSVERNGRPSFGKYNNRVNYLIESFSIDSEGDNIIINSIEILNYLGCNFAE